VEELSPWGAPLPRSSTVALSSVHCKDLVSKLSGSALTRRRASDSPFTSARLFGGSIGMKCWCCQKTVGPPFGQQLCPDPIALCPCQNTEPAPFNAATPLVTPFVRLISVAVQPSLVFLALQRVGTRFLHGIYFFGHSD
jgi:hypothetical protein